MAGIQIRHDTLSSCLTTVPLFDRPFFGQSLDRCPTCQVIHPVKTVHLWLDSSGSCLVSKGVLADLQRAGMPQLTIVGEVAKPPPLRLVAGVTREQIDAANRKQIIYTQGAG